MWIPGWQILRFDTDFLNPQKLHPRYSKIEYHWIRKVIFLSKHDPRPFFLCHNSFSIHLAVMIYHRNNYPLSGLTHCHESTSFPSYCIVILKCCNTIPYYFCSKKAQPLFIANLHIIDILQQHPHSSHHYAIQTQSLHNPAHKTDPNHFYSRNYILMV